MGGVEMQPANVRKIPSLEAIKQLLSERLKLAEKLINEDIKSGVISVEDAGSFERLHEVTDPNCYVSDEGEPASSMEKDLLWNYDTENWVNYWMTLIESLDSWLRCGMEGKISDQLNDSILIERF